MFTDFRPFKRSIELFAGHIDDDDAMLGLRNLLRPTAGPSRLLSGGFEQVRFRSILAPRKVKYRKSQKGKPSVSEGVWAC